MGYLESCSDFDVVDDKVSPSFCQNKNKKVDLMNAKLLTKSKTPKKKKQGRNLLHMAAEMEAGSVVIRYLMKKNVDLNQKDHQGI